MQLKASIYEGTLITKKIISVQKGHKMHQRKKIISVYKSQDF